MTTKEVHIEAMKLTQQGIVARESGDEVLAVSLFQRAFELEKEAALSFLSNFEKEPTRSILFRSAATLALDCNKPDEAEKMVTHGLSGYPPEDIAEELRSLYENINFFRHLQLDGVTLSPSEVQLSFSGSGVGNGMINSDEFVDRYKKIELLTIRTAERKAGKPYRLKGKVSAHILEKVQPYFSVPRRASFAVTLRFGEKLIQQSLFDENPFSAEQVIDEMVEGLTLVNNGEEEKLRERIGDDRYYQNFISLVKAIAPDGKKITQVGLTYTRNGVEKSIGFIRPSSGINMDFSDTPSSSVERIAIQGVLKIADANQNKITIVDNKSKKQIKLDVPEGLNDIVKEYWDTEVKITIIANKNKNRLIDIDKV